mmetsp:Transcript_2679/g.3967  ORF Transcript_2679/g.3967 Transcript_2679/m.3967 type:complete len:200 (+) Transcript_2679:1741-2340(+)
MESRLPMDWRWGGGKSDNLVPWYCCDILMQRPWQIFVDGDRLLMVPAKKPLTMVHKNQSCMCITSIDSHTHTHHSNIHTRRHLNPHPLSQHSQIRLQLLLIIRTHQCILPHSIPHPHCPRKVHLPQHFPLSTTQHHVGSNPHRCSTSSTQSRQRQTSLNQLYPFQCQFSQDCGWKSRKNVPIIVILTISCHDVREVGIG